MLRWIAVFVAVLFALPFSAVTSVHADHEGDSHDRWRWVEGTRWFVPLENLLAFMSPADLTASLAVADQTLWRIDEYDDGSFDGSSLTVFWRRTPAGIVASDPIMNRMDGTISDDGDVRIVFTPMGGAGGVSTVGYGRMRRIDGKWRFEMQMGSGSGVRTMHWAYMTQFRGRESAFLHVYPPVSEASFDGSLRSEEWRPIVGTTWSATDAVLFPQGASFTVGWFRGGYFQCEGSTSDGSSLRALASVTPEGDVYAEFSVAGASVVARRGCIEQVGAGRYEMHWREPEGDQTIGGGASE